MKEMVTEMFNAFKGLYSSTPSGSTTMPTVTPSKDTTTVVGKRGRILKSPSLTTPKVDKGNGITRDIDDSPFKLVKATREEAKLIELSKPELIKVVKEVASKDGVDPKALRNMKGGKEFLKKYDAEYKFIQREHMEKLKKSRELKKKRFDQYVLTTQNRLKPKKIIDILIHPNTRPVTITVYRNNDQRNFNVHKNFKFGDIGEIPGELGINPSLPLPEQDPSLSSSRKRKALELEP
ncbi:hypothetical protein Tco_0775464 [Tanacetum coccineum]